MPPRAQPATTTWVRGSLTVESAAQKGEHAKRESGVDRPGAQAVHSTAPEPVSVLVTDPAGQLEQATADCVEYVPAGHAVQLVAPTEASVSVVEPAAQVAHATVDCAEK